MLRLLKPHRWWSYKVPPMLAVAYYTLATGAEVPPPLAATLAQLALFLVAVLGIGGFGHLFTDIFDVPEDRLTGRENAWDRLGFASRFGVLGAVLAASVLPWRWLPVGPGVVALLALELLCFAAYAVPPLRLKERGLPGIVADGCYAHVIPLLVAWLTFARAAGSATPPWGGALLATWALAVGMRHLLQHQALDAEHDRRAGVATVAVRRGRDATLRLVAGRLLPIELTAFLALVVALAPRQPAVALGFAAHVAWETVKLRTLWLEPVDPFGPLAAAERAAIIGTRLLSRFYELWLPLLLLAGVVVRAPEYVVLLLLHLVLFPKVLVQLTTQDLPLARARWRSAP